MSRSKSIGRELIRLQQVVQDVKGSRRGLFRANEPKLVKLRVQVGHDGGSFFYGSLCVCEEIGENDQNDRTESGHGKTVSDNLSS